MGKGKCKGYGGVSVSVSVSVCVGVGVGVGVCLSYDPVDVRHWPIAIDIQSIFRYGRLDSDIGHISTSVTNFRRNPSFLIRLGFISRADRHDQLSSDGLSTRRCLLT